MDFNWLDVNFLPWLIPVPPLISFALIILFTGRYKITSAVIAVIAVGLSFLMSMGVFFHTAFGTEDLGVTAGKAIYGDNITWMSLGFQEFKMGVMVDPLTAAMLFMVPIAILMIFVYSVGYMRAYPVDDPHQIRYARFFSYLSLFAGGMLTLVVSDNLLLLFIGWEIMGLCSYLLIGFLFEKKSSYQAGIKAFMTTRVADVLMLVGIGYLFVETGTLNFHEILNNSAVLERLGDADQTGFIGLSAAAIIGAFLVIGTVGKSAQFPLHGWLPDAMQGPTPVSAMIHAAAMVSAGVFMVVRMYPLLEAGGNPHHAEYTLPLIMMGLLGSITALGAAVLGVGQNDIKRVLAYSTISQLGFMVAALGIGAYVAAAFHLITHAFFKALLFMCSGAVIHAMEHGEHHLHAEGKHVEHREEPGEATPYGTDHIGRFGEAPTTEEWKPLAPQGITPDFVAVPNDMRLMGGLWHRIPITSITMLIGVLSLSGFPLVTAGFWSKDEILADSLLWITDPDAFSDAGNVAWLHIIVFLSLFTAAIFTAFYSLRMWILTFLGEPRSEIARFATLMHEHHEDHEHHHEEVVEETHAVVPHEGEAHEDSEEDVITMEDVRHWWSVYSNSALMQGPLVILAFFAITAGWVGIHPDFWVLEWITGGNNFIKNFLSKGLVHKPESPPLHILPVLASFTAFFVGAGLAYFIYTVPRDEEKDPVERAIGDGAWNALGNRFFLDTLFLRLFYVPFEWFGRKVAYLAIDKETIDETLHSIADAFVFVGETFKRFNRVVIDGVGDGIPMLLWGTGRWFRNLQSGRIQQYLLFSALMLLAIGTFFLLQLF
ncbi:MAG: hypothetical protein GYB66_01570 [Chloroflexi bacterium]|nr:hypothetical protein [Chloroflexota bacterium]